MAGRTVQIGAATVVHGDCCSLAPTIGPVDAIVTDPPYHLGPVKQGGATKSFDPSNRGQTSSPFVGHGGFMGQTWDGGDIAFRPETWAAIGAALKPGGYLLAFGGTRTHHRIWCAIEDAGFVIQDTIMWMYGQGFPKGRTQLKPAYEPLICAQRPFTTQVDWNRLASTTIVVEALLWTLIDASRVARCLKRQGKMRAAQERSTVRLIAWLLELQSAQGVSATTDMFKSQEAGSIALNIASLWNAILAAVWKNGSTFTTEKTASLQTSSEILSVLISAITPESTIGAAIQQHGVWLSVSGAGANSSAASYKPCNIPTPSVLVNVTKDIILGIRSTLATVAEKLFPPHLGTIEDFAQTSAPIDLTTASDGAESDASALGVAPFLMLSPAEIQSIAEGGVWPSHTSGIEVTPICVAYKPGGKRTLQVDECRIGTTVETWPSSRARPISNALYTHKLSGDHRTKTVATGESPPGRWPANVCHDGSPEVLEAFAAFGDRRSSQGGGNRANGESIFGLGADGGHSKQYFDAGSAARFFKACRADDTDRRFGYYPKASKVDRAGSKHPTVKPIALMRWLVKLVTPIGGTVLDPFAGSGTTGAAALAEGRRVILVEQSAEYIADIKRRLKADQREIASRAA